MIVVARIHCSQFRVAGRASESSSRVEPVDRVLGLARDPALAEAIVAEARKQVAERTSVVEQRLAELVA
jgi:hypothetical protein